MACREKESSFQERETRASNSELEAIYDGVEKRMSHRSLKNGSSSNPFLFEKSLRNGEVPKKRDDEIEPASLKKGGGQNYLFMTRLVSDEEWAC